MKKEKKVVYGRSRHPIWPVQVREVLVLGIVDECSGAVVFHHEVVVVAMKCLRVVLAIQPLLSSLKAILKAKWEAFD